MDTLFANVMTNPKFLYSAFYDYDNQRVIDFFEENGLATKVERGNRVFPVSDHSSDVIATLQRVLKRTGVMVPVSYTHLACAHRGAGRTGRTNRRNGVFKTSCQELCRGGEYPGAAKQ